MKFRFLIWGLLLVSVLFSLSCSDNNSSAPPVNEAHPDNWVSVHGQEAMAEPEYDACQLCHAPDLRGSGTAPSCFSPSLGTQSCHAGGPGAPHPLDGSFLDPASHGPQAKADLTVCQGCHGEAGGAGDNPRFNVGIYSAAGTGCEASGCHATGYAHPELWAGPNTTFHYSAGNIQNACTLCHGINLDGGRAPGCVGCHDSTTSFSLDCTFCHGYPPDGTQDSAVPHGNVSSIEMHKACTVCHGMSESVAGGGFMPVAGYALFDASTGSSGDHWDGRIHMNGDTGYNESNFGCDAAGCHVNDPAHVLSDSGLDVALGAYGFGGSLPHPLDSSFLSPADHGPAAEGRTDAFPNGLLDCQPCHAEAGLDNPRFNIGIYSVSGTGCEGCHSTNTAHPSTPNFWYDQGWTHSDIVAEKMRSMCVLCHETATGAPASGGVGPACSSCHPADPLVSSAGCVSCHNLPPDGRAPVGVQRPNRAGGHTRSDHASWINDCSNCHAGAGFGTAWHFDQAAPADVNLNSWGGTYNSATGECSNVSCHGSEDEGFFWY